MANGVDPNRVGGTLFLSVDGVGYDLKGSWTHNIGSPLREPVVGTSSTHGYSEKPQAPMLEGSITDRANISLETLTNIRQATGVLSLANGKQIVYREMWWSGEGNVTSEEGEIAARFHARFAEEIGASAAT